MTLIEATVAAVGLLISGGALLFAVLAWLSSRRSVGLSESSLEVSRRQLALAEEQAGMLPRLEVTAVHLVDIEDAGVEMQELVRTVEEERAEEERERRARAEKLETLRNVPRQQREVEMWSYDNERRLLRDPLRYEGPLPDKVIDLRLANRGKATAFRITGTLSFEAAHLEPLGYFNHDADVFLQNEMFVTNVGNVGEIMLTPGKELFLTAAVAVLAPGTTKIHYDLSSPSGSSATGSLELEIPDEQPR